MLLSLDFLQINHHDLYLSVLTWSYVSWPIVTLVLVAVSLVRHVHEIWSFHHFSNEALVAVWYASSEHRDRRA